MSNHRQAQAPSTLHLCSCVSRNRRRGGAHHNCCKEKVERFLLLWKDALFSWTWSRIPQGACYQAGLKISPARKEVLVLGDAWQIPPPVTPRGKKKRYYLQCPNHCIKINNKNPHLVVCCSLNKLEEFSEAFLACSASPHVAGYKQQVQHEASNINTLAKPT